MERCACGEVDCWYLPGYPYCRSCGEHHRPPECDIDEQGRSLTPDGEPWEVADARYFESIGFQRLPNGRLVRVTDAASTRRQR